MEDPTSGLQNAALFITVFFPVLALIVVILRTYGRWTGDVFGWDDSIILLAMAMSIGETYVTWMYIKLNYIGIHIQYVPKHDPVLALKYTYLVPVLYNPILAIVKNSMLVFLLRISGSRDSVRYSIYALMAVNTASMIAIFFTLIFQCTPIEYNWNSSINGHCIEEGTFYVSSACVTIFTDFFILAIPFWIVMGLRMSMRKKIAVVGVFFIGGIVTVVGIVRVVLLVQGFFYPNRLETDYTYNIGFCISAIETNLAIVAASCPALRPLFKRWFPRLFSAPMDLEFNTPYEGPNQWPARSSAKSTGKSKSSTISSALSSNITTKSKSTFRSKSGDKFELNTMRGVAEIPGEEQRGESEEEIMTMDGIVKTTNVSVQYVHREEGRNDGDSSKAETMDYGVRTSVESL
ncbi:hypothetical protein G7Y89_g11261 [Cudoniella acicularis]|uniref:Rhodopsin domain-containing protein n=1 Tax=Cudoniella acicularis TaxID=354080 RepID=A0A8H4W0T3_9HELO|nr:hypothetical protein G7Y89_g11261 [Cudoniella acicularis]